MPETSSLPNTTRLKWVKMKKLVPKQQEFIASVARNAQKRVSYDIPRMRRRAYKARRETRKRVPYDSLRKTTSKRFPGSIVHIRRMRAWRTRKQEQENGGKHLLISEAGKKMYQITKSGKP